MVVPFFTETMLVLYGRLGAFHYNTDNAVQLFMSLYGSAKYVFSREREDGLQKHHRYPTLTIMVETMEIEQWWQPVARETNGAPRNPKNTESGPHLRNINRLLLLGYKQGSQLSRFFTLILCIIYVIIYHISRFSEFQVERPVSTD